MNSLYKLILFIAIIALIALVIISIILSKSSIMGGFQKTILIVAIILLLINLVIISLGLHYSSKKRDWPPIIPNCPDYWVSEGSGSNITCTNVKDLGECKPSSEDPHLVMDFNKAPFVGENGNCAKYQWANKCKVAWDGITYGVNNPCV